MSKSKKDSKKQDTNQAPETKEEQQPTVEVEDAPKADELAQTKEQLLRTAAEYANFRARSAKEKEQTFANAKSTVVAELLPVIDNLERALGSDDSDYETLKQGVQMTLNGLLTSLTKLGVEAYGENGDKFDPNFHNAVMHIEDEELEENTITDVFQKGYKINEKVIRPAMVKTAN